MATVTINNEVKISSEVNSKRAEQHLFLGDTNLFNQIMFTDIK